MAGWESRLRSWSAGVLLELTRFDFAGDLLSDAEENERAAKVFQKVSGEKMSSAIKVGMELKRTWRQQVGIAPGDDCGSAEGAAGFIAGREHLESKTGVYTFSRRPNAVRTTDEGSRQGPRWIQVSCVSQLWKDRLPHKRTAGQ